MSKRREVHVRHGWQQTLGAALLGTLLFSQPGWAADETVTVSAKDLQELKENYKELKREVQQLKEALARQTGTTAPAVAVEKKSYASAGEVQRFKEKLDQINPGLTKFLVTGYTDATFTNTQRAKTNSNFGANFKPIFLWEPTDRLLFEGELEFELEDSATTTNLEYADVSYLLNDYMTLEAGKFLFPFGAFMERVHPAWINKLPDKPLVYTDGSTQLVPESEIGAQVRGAVPLPWFGAAKANYAFWVSNGPTVQTSATNAGELAFTNTDDTNNNKALGGRIGIFPIPELEVGYSLLESRVGSSSAGDPGVRATLQGLDLSYVRACEPLKGTVDVRSEWIWSHLGAFNYGTATGAFSNNRGGGYIQGSYRPAVGGKIVEKLEPTVRYDLINQPNDAPSNQDEERWTLGVGYHLSPGAVVKAAYRLDKRRHAADRNAFLCQVALGF